MAFDFGEKRIGVATGETMLKNAHALITIETEVTEMRFVEIGKLVTEWRPSLLIVGLPMYMDGTAHALTNLSKKFAQRLEGRFNLPVMMVDERLSSAEAAQQLSDAGVYAREQKTMIDALKAGDEVATTGGVVGKISKVGDNFISIEIASNTVVNVQRHAVQTLLPPGTIKSI